MTFVQGLQLTAIAMVIVFTLLFMLSLIVGLFKYIPQEKVKVVSKNNNVSPPVMGVGVSLEELEADEEMMVAGIVATMDAAEERKETNYKIVRITKI